MPARASYLTRIKDPLGIVTPIEAGLLFPEVLEVTLEKYTADIEEFARLVMLAPSSGELLRRIRSGEIHRDQRMSLLKMFRRCVALVCDTETTKKIEKVSTETLIETFGASFKPIEKLKVQFGSMGKAQKAALAALIGEYDFRGQQGYTLTEQFFDWFEDTFPDFSIVGPRRSGRDVQLSKVFSDFESTVGYPCDFVIGDKAKRVLAVGFARYDSTRGGAQSDDRTNGNSYKVAAAREFCQVSGRRFRIAFLSEGPGLTHNDTWAEACALDDSWDGNVRVFTLKLAALRLTREWLLAG